MLIIPVCYFSLLLIAIIRKNGYDVSAGMTTAFLVTSVAGYFLGNTDFDFNYENYSRIKTPLIPVLVYCFTNSLCIYPFYKYGSKQELYLADISNIGLFKKVVWFYLVIFLLLLFVFRNDFLYMFLQADLGELRNMGYSGDLVTAMDKLSGISRTIAGAASIFGDGAYMLIVFFFYSMSKLSLGKFFNLCILLSSLSPVILGMANVDRSKTTFWIFLFFMCFLIYRKALVKSKYYALFKKMCIGVALILFAYIGAVSLSRWGDRDGGASMNMLCYLGQPIINFCNIWENLDDDHFFINRVFPCTSYFILGNDFDEISNFVIRIYAQKRIHVNVFFSFVGMFLVDLGHIMAIIFPIVFMIIETSILKSINRFKYYSLYSTMCIFMIGAVVQCGIITYFYSTVPRVLSIALFLFLCKKIGINLRKN